VPEPSLSRSAPRSASYAILASLAALNFASLGILHDWPNPDKKIYRQTTTLTGPDKTQEPPNEPLN
jgi:hypothetical protein